MKDFAPRRSRLGLRIVIGVLVCILFLTLATRGVDLAESWRTLRSAQLWLLCAAAMSVLATAVMKALRWRLFFRPRRQLPRIWTCVAATLAGQALNLALPLRVGDLTRAYFVGAWEAESKSYALGTIALEKVIDLWLLFLFVIALIPFVALPAWFRDSEVALGILAILLILITLIMALKREELLTGLSRLVAWLPARFRPHFISSARLALSSLEALGDKRALAMIWVWSLASWILAAVTNQLVFWAFNMNLPFTAAVFLLVVLQAGVAVPSSPGKLGVFQYICVLALGAFAVDSGVAFGYSWGLYMVVLLPIALSGILVLWVQHFRLGSVWTSALLAPGTAGEES